MDVCLSCMLRVFGCVFSSIPLLFVYLHLRMSSYPRSIAGVPLDSVGRFRDSLLLQTTCMRSCCNFELDCWLCGGITNQTQNKSVVNCFTPTDGGDQTWNNYDCLNFQQFFTRIPVHIKYVFSGVLKFLIRFSLRKRNPHHSKEWTGNLSNLEIQTIEVWSPP